MKKKIWTLNSIAVMVVAIVVVTAYSQENVKSVQDSAFKTKMRPGAVFLHDDHNGKAEIDDCGTCHHVYKDGVKIEDETSEDMECSECHRINGNTVTLVAKYHLRCKGCHEEKKAGPVMCSDCHVK
ncbi:MAG: cytochrome c family protein [Proteobacteria bacterium]|nr:cytochrome c family protein [Pseudomonadota bacterium]